MLFHFESKVVFLAGIQLETITLNSRIHLQLLIKQDVYQNFLLEQAHLHFRVLNNCLETEEGWFWVCYIAWGPEKKALNPKNDIRIKRLLQK